MRLWTPEPKKIIQPFQLSALVNGGMVNDGHSLVGGGVIRAHAVPGFDLTGLQAYYKFEGSAGSKGTDSYGSNTMTDHGTVGDATGILGNAGVFSSTKYQDIADNASLSMGTSVEFTITAWFYPTSSPGNDSFGNPKGHIVAKGTSTGAANTWEWGFWYRGSDVQIFVSDGSSVANTTTNTSATTNAWNFVYLQVRSNGGTPDVATRMNQASTEAVASQHVWARDSTASTCMSVIAGDSSKGCFNGRLDSIGIWKRKLTSTELDTLYNSGAGYDPV